MVYRRRMLRRLSMSIHTIAFPFEPSEEEPMRALAVMR